MPCIIYNIVGGGIVTSHHTQNCLDDDWFREPACRRPHFWKMASAQPHGSCLSQDIAKIRSNELVIDDLTKTVKLLEKEEPTQGTLT